MANKVENIDVPLFVDTMGIFCKYNTDNKTISSKGSFTTLSSLKTRFSQEINIYDNENNNNIKIRRVEFKQILHFNLLTNNLIYNVILKNFDTINKSHIFSLKCNLPFQ